MRVCVGLRSNPCPPGRYGCCRFCRFRVGSHPHAGVPVAWIIAPSRGRWLSGEETPRVVIVEVDAHKAPRTCVVIDSTGRIVGEKTEPATTDGHNAALRW